MAMSGIGLHEDAIAAYKEMKMDKTHDLMRFEIMDKKVICYVKEKSLVDCSNEDLLEYLTCDENKAAYFYLLYDFKLKAKKELIVIAWIPDIGKIGSKMIYSTSVESLKKKFDGVKLFIVANDLDDINRELDGKFKVTL